MHTRRFEAFLTGAILIGTLMALFTPSQARLSALSLAQTLPASMQRDAAAASPEFLRTLLLHEAGEFTRRLVEAWATVRVGIAGTLLAVSMLPSHRSLTPMISAGLLLIFSIASTVHVIPELHVAATSLELKWPNPTGADEAALDSARLRYYIVEATCVAVTVVLAFRLLVDFHGLRSGTNLSPAGRRGARGL
ncbi:MAG TPA: hypothetical protein VES20_06515 [Bryobacteraceae bacterium]|nr:hypothetical protein [Bryobacteraceae bacterium]